MNIGRFRNYQCFTSLRKITIALKKLWSKRWILKWPCRRGLFFHPHLHHTSFDSRRFVGTHCAWGQLETKETLVFFLGKVKRSCTLCCCFFFVQFATKTEFYFTPSFPKDVFRKVARSCCWFGVIGQASWTSPPRRRRYKDSFVYCVLHKCKASKVEW